MNANLERGIFSPIRGSWGGAEELCCSRYNHNCPCCNCLGVKCSAPCCPCAPVGARPACLTQCCAPSIPTRFCCPSQKPPPCSPPRFCRGRSCCGGGCGVDYCCECSMGLGCGCANQSGSCCDCRCSVHDTCYTPRSFCCKPPGLPRTGRLYEP